MANNTNTSKEKVKKENKVAKGTKEIVSELKKVTWPSFGKVCKQTLVVLGVVIFFTVVLFGIDRLLSWLFKLLIG
ncbi:MAG: preprotein translocase subunit SecE [Christensenellales bacterium]